MILRTFIFLNLFPFFATDSIGEKRSSFKKEAEGKKIHGESSSSSRIRDATEKIRENGDNDSEEGEEEEEEEEGEAKADGDLQLNALLGKLQVDPSKIPRDSFLAKIQKKMKKKKEVEAAAEKEKVEEDDEDSIYFKIDDSKARNARQRELERSTSLLGVDPRLLAEATKMALRLPKEVFEDWMDEEESEAKRVWELKFPVLRGNAKKRKRKKKKEDEEDAAEAMEDSDVPSDEEVEEDDGLNEEERKEEEEAEMALKLLKKSKQRRLLEEVKKTALGVGQESSWKGKGKAMEDAVIDPDEFLFKEKKTTEKSKGRKSSAMETDDTLIDLYRRGVLFDAVQRNPNTFFVYSGDVSEAKKDPVLNLALRKIEKRRQSLYIESLPPIGTPGAQFNANGMPVKPGEGSAAHSPPNSDPFRSAAAMLSRQPQNQNSDWSSVSQLKDTINSKPLVMLKAEEIVNYKQTLSRVDGFLRRIDAFEVARDRIQRFGAGGSTDAATPSAAGTSSATAEATPQPVNRWSGAIRSRVAPLVITAEEQHLLKVLKDTKDKRTKTLDILYQWRSKVKERKTRLRLAKIREEQAEAAEGDSRRAAALGSVLSQANKSRSGGKQVANGRATNVAFRRAAADKAGRALIEALQDVGVERTENKVVDKKREKEAATERIIKSGIGVDLIGAKKRLKSVEEEEEEVEEEERVERRTSKDIERGKRREEVEKRMERRMSKEIEREKRREEEEREEGRIERGKGRGEKRERRRRNKDISIVVEEADASKSTSSEETIKMPRLDPTARNSASVGTSQASTPHPVSTGNDSPLFRPSSNLPRAARFSATETGAQLRRNGSSKPESDGKTASSTSAATTPKPNRTKIKNK